MKTTAYLLAITATLAACEVSTESALHSYNGATAEIELYGDTFAYGTEAQKQAQIEAAKVKAQEACGGPAKFMSRRMDHQPQNGIYHVPARNIAIFRCEK